MEIFASQGALMVSVTLVANSHRSQQHRRQQILPPVRLVSLIPVENLPPVSTILATNLPPVSTTLVVNNWNYIRLLSAYTLKRT